MQILFKVILLSFSAWPFWVISKPIDFPADIPIAYNINLDYSKAGDGEFISVAPDEDVVAPDEESLTFCVFQAKSVRDLCKSISNYAQLKFETTNKDIVNYIGAYLDYIQNRYNTECLDVSIKSITGDAFKNRMEQEFQVCLDRYKNKTSSI